MNTYNIDPYLTSVQTKGNLLSLLIATLFAKFESRIKNSRVEHSFTEKKELLTMFQTVYDACSYIECHDLSEPSDYSTAGRTIESLCMGSNAVNIPDNFRKLLQLFSDFMEIDDRRFEFIFDVPTELHLNKTKTHTDYLVRSIFRECSVVDYKINSHSINIKLEV